MKRARVTVYQTGLSLDCYGCGAVLAWMTDLGVPYMAIQLVARPERHTKTRLARFGPTARSQRRRGDSGAAGRGWSLTAVAYVNCHVCDRSQVVGPLEGSVDPFPPEAWVVWRGLDSDVLDVRQSRRQADRDSDTEDAGT